LPNRFVLLQQSLASLVFAILTRYNAPTHVGAGTFQQRAKRVGVRFDGSHHRKG
jgi:hypothetical protein